MTGVTMISGVTSGVTMMYDVGETTARCDHHDECDCDLGVTWV